MRRDARLADDDLVVIDSDEFAALLDLNQRLFDANDKDIEFVLCDGKEYAHKTVLRAVSAVWTSMFASGMKEQMGVIEVNDATRKDMRVFLRAIYTRQLNPMDWMVHLNSVERAEASGMGAALNMPEEELEINASHDDRSRHTHSVGFEKNPTMPYDVFDHGGQYWTLRPKDVMQNLVAETCANVGMKRGRYFYEVKIIEDAIGRTRHASSPTKPEMLVRVGFSTGMGGEQLVACFQNDGVFMSPGTQEKAATPFDVNDTVAVLLNLERGVPNSNTLSIFRNGSRASHPQPLPHVFHTSRRHADDFALFPFVAFCNVSLEVRFGFEPQQELPFRCRMLRDAASGDVVCDKAMHPKVPLDILVTVMMLAKRYMVKSVMSMAIQSLKARMQAAAKQADVITFQKIFSMSISSDVGPLRMACLQAAKDFVVLHKTYRANGLQPEVQFELEAIWPTAQLPLKRMRFA